MRADVCTASVLCTLALVMAPRAVAADTGGFESVEMWMLMEVGSASLPMAVRALTDEPEGGNARAGLADLIARKAGLASATSVHLESRPDVPRPDDDFLLARYRPEEQQFAEQDDNLFDRSSSIWHTLAHGAATIHQAVMGAEASLPFWTVPIKATIWLSADADSLDDATALAHRLQKAEEAGATPVGAPWENAAPFLLLPSDLSPLAFAAVVRDVAVAGVRLNRNTLGALDDSPPENIRQADAANFAFGHFAKCSCLGPSAGSLPASMNDVCSSPCRCAGEYGAGAGCPSAWLGLGEGEGCCDTGMRCPAPGSSGAAPGAPFAMENEGKSCVAPASGEGAPKVVVMPTNCRERFRPNPEDAVPRNAVDLALLLAAGDADRAAGGSGGTAAADDWDARCAAAPNARCAWRLMMEDCALDYSVAPPPPPDRPIAAWLKRVFGAAPAAPAAPGSTAPSPWFAGGASSGSGAQPDANGAQPVVTAMEEAKAEISGAFGEAANVVRSGVVSAVDARLQAVQDEFANQAANEGTDLLNATADGVLARLAVEAASRAQDKLLNTTSEGTGGQVPAPPPPPPPPLPTWPVETDYTQTPWEPASARSGCVSCLPSAAASAGVVLVLASV